MPEDYNFNPGAYWKERAKRAEEDALAYENDRENLRDNSVYLKTAIQRVRDLHKPVERSYIPDRPYCEECGQDDDGELTLWPCNTIKALDGDNAQEKHTR